MTQTKAYTTETPAMRKKTALVLFLALLSSSVSGPPERTSESAFRPVFVRDGHMNAYEFRKFQDHTLDRLPSYKKIFKKYSQKYNVPWTLLAAVAYQESKWDEKAVSYTGVKGLMQLTLQTALHVGISDREDPYESIRGGAYYLQYLYGKTSKKLKPHQRWTQALAAYNIGWGHLRDAHRLAAKLKKNPYQWNDLKEVLPFLEDEQYALDLRYGMARGNETVDFVDNVFRYYKILNTTFSVETTIAGL